jgi:Na+/H+ antiporter NhaD/arsenite permease-like protein
MIEIANVERRTDSRIAIMIVLIACVYVGLVVSGYVSSPPPSNLELPVADSTAGIVADSSDHVGSVGHADLAQTDRAVPPMFAVIPFVALLAAIAIFPLLKSVGHWWENNLHRFYIAAGLAVCTLAYYGVTQGTTSVGHVLHHAILQEYVPFIVLLFSLYTISGGIRISGDLAATPGTNCLFLAVGGLLASLIGTTGAAMLLIRPLIETNAERRNVQHTIVFFIFIVCNCGGCLLPIGDPPLFLGYLKGVEFLWTLWNLFLPWLCVNAALIALYLVLDRFVFFPQEAARDLRLDRAQIRPLRIRGLLPNVPLLIGVILAVALLDPSKPQRMLGHWQPWPYLREMMQLLFVAASLRAGSQTTRAENQFNYIAIIEVAVLFVGIFITMQPALEILHVIGPELGLDSPIKFFWATGTLSSVLDNAPTYVVFFEAADAAFHGPLSQLVEEPGLARDTLAGISLGAVFMGAMTYIGNGPNFMVRAIAEHRGIRMPSFFGYVFVYSVPMLLPILALMTLLFLRS